MINVRNLAVGFAVASTMASAPAFAESRLAKRHGTAVVRDDVSGIRRGDYVTLSGEWSRNGVFNAYDLLDLRDGRYDRANERMSE